MAMHELEGIIDKGAEKCEMVFANDARAKIAIMSQGLPHYTHLLGLHSAQIAIQRGDNSVSAEDVRGAIDIALTKAQQSIISAYHKATSSSRENLYKQVLLACAMAQVDDMGYFAAMDLRVPMSRIMGRPYDIPAYSQHLNAFTERARGPILQRTGERRRFRFRFINPLIQPYVIMDGIQRNLISEHDGEKSALAL